jgi:hypothetical protein
MVLEMLMLVATVAIIAFNDRIIKLYFMFWIKKKMRNITNVLFSNRTLLAINAEYIEECLPT